MKTLNAAAGLILLCLLLLCPCLLEAKSPPAPGEQAFVDLVLQPFWQTKVMHGESLLFVKKTDQTQPSATLLFKPTEILRVNSADGKVTYRQGEDYVVDKEAGTLSLPAGSRITFKMLTELFPPMKSDSKHKIPWGHKTGDPTLSVMWGEGMFHGLQVEVTYRHAPGTWKGHRPLFSGEQLPGTLKTLRQRKPLSLVIFGDSISAGCNASHKHKPPHMPPFPIVLTEGLKKTYGGPVALKNLSVGGANTGWKGIDLVKEVAGQQPDQLAGNLLVMIAYGMNDFGHRNPAGYKKKIGAMIDEIRKVNPKAEFILVASMLGNTDWNRIPEAKVMLQHRDALAELCADGIVLADLTAIWEEMLERKNFVSMTGNGVNHPNDFGHRVYAQAILALLVKGKSGG